MIPVSIDDVWAATEKITGVSVAERRGPWLSARKPRLYFYYAAADCFSFDVATIAKEIDRDHTTVREALNKVRAKYILNPDVIDAIEDEAIRLADFRWRQAA